MTSELQVLSGASEENHDVRVKAVRKVLGGKSVVRVAQDLHLDPLLLQRWVNAFVESGTARVANKPDGDLASQRDRFLGAFAHEMRTPLTIALGWIDILSDEALPPIVTTTVHKLETALQQLHERTVDVELLAGAALGRLRLDPGWVPVDALTSDLRRLESVEGVDADAVVYVDPKLFRRVLRDLWDAAFVTPTPRRVRLRVEQDGPWMEFCVVREADPIDVPLLQAMLEPFHLNEDNTGVTVGLYLARALAVAHGGTIGVDQDDQSARFWVRIPHRPDRGPTGENTRHPRHENGHH